MSCYGVDHIVPLASCGADSIENIQWQTKAEVKVKDRWERKHCRAPGLTDHSCAERGRADDLSALVLPKSKGMAERAGFEPATGYEPKRSCDRRTKHP